MLNESRRRFMVGAGMAGVAATVPNLFAKAAKAAAGPLQACIDQCHACEDACVSTVQYCLSAGGAHVQSDHITALLDCAALCRTSAETMLRNSALVPDVCGVCAKACTACATSCEAWTSDSTMQACAAECRSCADSCESMAG